MKTNPKALSSFSAIKNRCETRRTKIREVVNTKRDRDEVFVLVFEDGTQANVDYETLSVLHMEAPELWRKEHHTELV